MSEQPPEYELLSEEKAKEMLKLFKGERTGFVLVGKKKYFFPYRYIEQSQGFYNFIKNARKDDTWVLSYPRSGTTMTQELVWLLANNLDFDVARKRLLSERFPFLEFSLFNHPEVTREFLAMNKDDEMKQQLCQDIAKPGYEVIDGIPSPRFIKSHFPFSMLPGLLDVGCKVVYVARNPKDVATSFYHLNRSIKTQGYIGDFTTFWNYFENNLIPWAPYWEHLKEAWNLRNSKNLLFMFYEEITHDLPAAIKKIAKFLEKEYTDEEILKVADYLDINNFKNNPMVNFSELRACKIMEDKTFVRKGINGDWKNIFTVNLNAKADKWIEENLRDTDLRFPFYNNINNNN
ncbi:sulfotransferase 1C4 [Solenopsis invicta]|uniref:sulfotransferase 1C4 n=1 Tax=Solenopsis invicta TaxID=13686 RepID=UPI00193EA946|nr:sulfotransferase 1C4 [Solenopsis invicta]XP_039313429.1 sulfotransferase 1C4 [Solenopsis invicta]XP_039313430.1 sulfotransferase 1C4 [Solenopsis invicta]XP_039313431.1 sulfotransferase 1C4 [Solenopsis invicta]XP_039313432.1 sulfotransferase 1C4 [Solenopsis invicta]